MTFGRRQLGKNTRISLDHVEKRFRKAKTQLKLSLAKLGKIMTIVSINTLTKNNRPKENLHPFIG